MLTVQWSTAFIKALYTNNFWVARLWKLFISH